MSIPADDSSDDLARRVEAFAALERAQDLFSYRVDGWSPWRVIRNWAHRSSLLLIGGETQRRAGPRIREAMGATLKCLVLLVTAPRADVLVKTCRSALRLHENGRRRDIYFDGLLSRFDSSFKLEEINVDSHKGATKTMLYPPDLNPIVFTFWGRVFSTLFPLRAARPFCDKLSIEIERAMGVHLSSKALLGRASTIHWQARLYGLLLKRLRPSIVLVGDTGEYGLRLACGRLGISFLELQHGVFDRDHPDAVPADVPGSAEELLLPDVLACRGQYWIDQLSTTRLGRDGAVAVGHELLDRAREKRSRRPEAPATVVFTGQGYDVERAVAWLGEAIACAPQNLDWRLIIKLHPGYELNSRAYDGLAEDTHVTIVPGPDDPNVYDLLADADLHLSVSSACFFDAAALGVRSMVMPLRSHELILFAVDGSAIALAERPGDIWEAMKRPPLTEDDRRHYAKPGFLDNMEALVRRT